MEYKINDREREALRGLPYLQRLLYYEGMRPYMDFSTGIVGIKRGISYQSLSEELYIEPHQGYKSGSPSKAQLRRAIRGLESSGLIQALGYDKRLVFRCLLATQDYSVSKKVVTKPSHRTVIGQAQENQNKTAGYNGGIEKAVTPKTAKAVTPPVSGNYINSLSIGRSKNSCIDANFTPSPSVITEARKRKCPTVDCEDELSRFILHHRSRGTQSYDWDAEYLRWLLIGKEFNSRGKSNESDVKGQGKPRKRQAQSAVERVMQANEEMLGFPKGRIIECE